MKQGEPGANHPTRALQGNWAENTGQSYELWAIFGSFHCSQIRSRLKKLYDSVVAVYTPRCSQSQRAYWSFTKDVGSQAQIKPSHGPCTNLSGASSLHVRMVGRDREHESRRTLAELS